MGSLAVHAAATRGCRVTTTTISREQHDHAVAAVRRAGLEDRVTVLLSDYRDLTGRYDKLVSIEMIEAVGWRHIGTFFAKCSELLADDGAMLLQAITIDDRAYEIEKASRSFINTHIFPGGCLPSLEVIARNVARRTDMQTVGLEDLTAHYVETLRRWEGNFAAHADALADLGYDERFRRLWTLYLKYCEAGFAERRICDIQLTLAKPRHRPAGLCRFGPGRFTEERTTGQEGQTIMAKRGFRPEDGLRLRTATDPDLSPDGRRVAFVSRRDRRGADRLCASMWVAPLDGSAPARRFTEGPADKQPALVPGPPLARVHLGRR